MNKFVRGVLYVSSILLIIVVLAAVWKNKKQQQAQETVSSEEVKAEESTEQLKDTAEKDTEQPQESVEESTEQPEEPVESDNTQTTLVFTGDILIGNRVSGNYNDDGIDGILSPQMQNLLQDADIAMVNEEFPFSTRGTAMEDKQYTFRINPSYVSAFQDMGVDIVSLANNHVLDYGPEALEDTFTTLDHAGILYAGAGGSKERAEELQIIEVNGKKYGFLAASRVIPVASWNIENGVPGVFATYDAAALLNAITLAEEKCDYLTVFVHWGLEHKEYPEDYERALAAQYVEAGADLVIGSHSHCLQGVEYIDGKPVFYSLGNFLFGQDGNTAAVKVTIDEDGKIEYAFIAAKEEGAYTSEMSEGDAKVLYSYLTRISKNAVVDENGILSEK